MIEFYVLIPNGCCLLKNFCFEPPHSIYLINFRSIQFESFQVIESYILKYLTDVAYRRILAVDCFIVDFDKSMFQYG